MCSNNLNCLQNKTSRLYHIRRTYKAPFIWRKVVPGKRITLLAESTLPRVYMRKKLTTLPEPRADRFSFDHQKTGPK